MKKLLLLIIFSFSLNLCYSQIGIYAGMDMGVTVSKVNIISASDTKNVSGIDGIWGGIVGVNLKNNWSIESGYFGFITSSDVLVTDVESNGEKIYTPTSSVIYFGDIVPLRIKKQLDFTFLKNNFSFLPSLGVLFMNTTSRFNGTPHQSTYQPFQDPEYPQYGNPYTINVTSTRKILHDTQYFLEASTTLKTPFILKNAAIFLRTGYAFGLKRIGEIEESNYIVELDQTQRFRTRNRVSYFNASVGLQFNFLTIKKATSN